MTHQSDHTTDMHVRLADRLAGWLADRQVLYAKPTQVFRVQVDRLFTAGLLLLLWCIWVHFTAPLSHARQVLVQHSHEG